MNTWSLWIAIFCGIAIAQSFFLSGYLIIRDQKRTSPTFFLSLMLVGLALRISKSYFYFIFEDVPRLGVALGAMGLWFIGPSLFLYTKSAKPDKINFSDYFHFFPALLIFAVFGFLITINFGTVYHIGAGHLFIYLLISIYYFYSNTWNGNKKRFVLFAGSIGAISLIFLVQSLIGGIQIYTIGTLLTLLVLYFVNFLILQDQSFLQIKRTKNRKINKEQKSRVSVELERLFNQEKLYRQKGLTLAEVAKSINHPAYIVSQTINHHYGLKFNQFVNKFRVEEVKERLRDIEKNDKIEVIAIEVGFSSTSSLYSAFKRETDSTPQAFRRQFLVPTKIDQ